jgi:hypothetical protein
VVGVGPPREQEAPRSSYDVFISGNGRHASLTRQIVRQLRAAGRSVFHDQDSVVLGVQLEDQVRRALAISRRIALILSPAALGEPWQALDLLSRGPAVRASPTDTTILVVAETIADAALPPGLRGLRRADLTSQAERDGAYAWLLRWLGLPGAEPAIPPRWEDLAPASGGRRLEARFVHELPPAPHFVGRDEELRQLDDFWDAPAGGVFALVGIGGAGKTAIVERFCARLLRDDRRRPGGFFAWSFYEEPDPAAFLESAYEYFSGERRPEVKGAGWLHLLKDALSGGEPHLLILDGLERVQRQKRRAPDGYAFGELEDPLLREFVKRLAAGAGRTKALITTRFPVVDLGPGLPGSCRSLDLGQIDEPAAIALLRSHGVQGSDSDLRKLFEACGRHALTLDHLGSLLGRYFDGRPEWAPLVEPPDPASTDPQAHHLASVLRAYEKCLDERELAVLSRLCVFQHGVTVESFHQSFVSGASSAVAGPLADFRPEAIRELLENLVKLHLVLREGGRRYTVHPAVRDHFYQTFARPQDLHEAACRHLSDLAGRPGASLPRDKWTLDQLEELVFHLVAAGREDEAERVYRQRLGGVRHLTDLGDFARGLRLLSRFRRIIDPDGTLRFRRGVGDLPSDEEWERYQGNLDFFSVHGPDLTRLLRGLLGEVDFSAARLLQGDDPHLFISHDFAPRFSAVLLSGKRSADLVHSGTEFVYRDDVGLELTTQDLIADERFQRYLAEHRESLIRELLAERPDWDSTHGRGYVLLNKALRRFLEERNFQKAERPSRSATVRSSPDDMAVWNLWMAELTRSEGDLAQARSYVEAGSRWILRASSQEHLCILHLVRARLATDSGNASEAGSALFEGLDIARRCRFRIFLIDLLNESARTQLLAGNPDMSEAPAREACALASAAETGYVWGEALAVHYLYRVCRAQGHDEEAMSLALASGRLFRYFERSPFLRDLRVPGETGRQGGV